MTEDSEQSRKLFLGGLNYSTTEENLKTYFETFGKLTDVVVMKFADTRRSRGFGFITFESAAEADACFAAGPHTVGETTIEVKRATPRKDEAGGGGADGPSGQRNEKATRKIFVGGMNYSTTDDALKEYFSKFGEVVDHIVMKFPDTKRSRGFGFVTFETRESVDAVQAARPHNLDDKDIETKRAVPRDQDNDGGDRSQVVSKRAFIGGLKDHVSDDDLKEYFSQYGNVTKIEQLVDKTTDRKRGFGFVEFDDYDPVDKVILAGGHHTIKENKLEIKRAYAKVDQMGGGGGGRMGGRGMMGGGGRGMGRNQRGGDQGGFVAPWAQGGGDEGGWGGAWGGDQGGWGGGFGQGYGGGMGGGAMRQGGFGGQRNNPYGNKNQGGGGRW